MKTLYISLGALLLAFGVPSIAHAQYVNAGCGQLIRSRIQLEDQAQAANGAADYGTAYEQYQQAVEYRANCAGETTGAAKQWNLYFEASDYFGLEAATTSDDSPWHDQASGFRSEAHEITNNLLNENLESGLRQLVQQLWNYTQGDG
jgi:hypothetical protein